jgi:hypothetical protein
VHHVGRRRFAEAHPFKPTLAEPKKIKFAPKPLPPTTQQEMWHFSVADFTAYGHRWGFSLFHLEIEVDQQMWSKSHENFGFNPWK